jgi:hypothetical protein
VINWISIEEQKPPVKVLVLVCTFTCGGAAIALARLDYLSDHKGKNLFWKDACTDRALSNVRSWAKINMPEAIEANKAKLGEF